MDFLRSEAPGACAPGRKDKAAGGMSGGGPVQRRAGRLQAVAGVLLTLMATMPQGFGQQLGAGQRSPERAASKLPPAPTPEPTQPLALRSLNRDYSKPFVPWDGNPIDRYRPISIPKANFENAVRLSDLVRDGKIYLSLSDALALAIQDNYDIAIARYDLDIADTDILRTKSGALPLGAPSGLVTGTLGGSTSTLTTGGGPGGTTVGSGGAGSGVNGLTLTTAGAGPTPEALDPSVTANVQLERATAPQANTLFSGGKSTLTTNTDQYNFTFNKGFETGANLAVSLTNERITTDNPFQDYSPLLESVFKATLTQHLLQGAGFWVNKRFIYQAINDRRITNASFRQQILYTVNQVENIYWGLVQAYEDVQAKQRALDQSTQLLKDDQKQLQIGTMAPLDVVNAESGVASDKEALISAENSLNYQQQIMKQAIARNLNDPVLSAAPVIPTDRVNLAPIPEESEPVEALVQEAFKRRPELEEAVLTLRNDEITLRGARNALLPTLDAYGFYGSSALGGSQSSDALDFETGGLYAPGTFPTRGYGSVVQNLFNSSAPDKGVGFNLTIPLSNREAQATQARSLMEYRQAELRLEQLYTEIRMQVANAKYGLSNDRAAVEAAVAAQNYDQQSLDAEEKKLHLGASTTANVLLQERNLATAEDNLINAHAQYAKDRASLYQILATTLQHYGINLNDAATGNVQTAPLVPGVDPAKPGNEPHMTPPAE
ncbi:MAG TPA: TolC family protein [Terracidiphilus sp.]|nr:TolC family protein [Terracidiphilus sp.]